MQKVGSRIGIIPILIGIGSIALAYGARQFYLLKHASYRIVGFKIKGVSNSRVSILLIIEMMNKGDLSAKITDQNYTILFNERVVSKINLTNDIQINSNGSTLLPLEIDFIPQNFSLKNLLGINKSLLEIQGVLSLEMGLIHLKNYKIDVKYTIQDLIDITKN